MTRIDGNRVTNTLARHIVCAKLHPLKRKASRLDLVVISLHEAEQLLKHIQELKEK